MIVCIPLIISLINASVLSKPQRDDLSTIFESDEIEAWTGVDLTSSLLNGPSDMMMRSQLFRPTKAEDQRLRYHYLQNNYQFKRDAKEWQMWSLIKDWVRDSRQGTIRLSQLPLGWNDKIAEKVQRWGIQAEKRGKRAILLRRGKQTVKRILEPVSQLSLKSTSSIVTEVEEPTTSEESISQVVKDLSQMRISHRHPKHSKGVRRNPRIARGLVRDDPTSRSWLRHYKRPRRQSGLRRKVTLSLESEKSEWSQLQSDLWQEERQRQRSRLQERIERAIDEHDEEFLKSMAEEREQRAQYQREQMAMAAERRALKRKQRAESSLMLIPEQVFQRTQSVYERNPFEDSYTSVGLSLEESMLMRQQVVNESTVKQRNIEQAEEIESQAGYLTNSILYDQAKGRF